MSSRREEVMPSAVRSVANPVMSAEEYDQHWREMAHLPNLKALRAFSDYMNFWVSHAINSSLRRHRGTEGMSKRLLPKVQRIDEAIQGGGFRTTYPLTLYRGIRDDVYHKIKGISAGNIIHDPAYVSTSSVRSIAVRYAYGIDPESGGKLLRITVPPGTWLAPAPDYIGDSEVVIPRGSRFRIDRVLGNTVDVTMIGDTDLEETVERAVQNPVEHRRDGFYAVLPKRFGFQPEWYIGPFTAEHAYVTAGLVSGASTEVLQGRGGYYTRVYGGLRLKGTPSIGPISSVAGAASIAGRVRDRPESVGHVETLPEARRRSRTAGPAPRPVAASRRRSSLTKAQQEAAIALTGLGYSSQEAARQIQSVEEEDDPEQIIRSVFRTAQNPRRPPKAKIVKLPVVFWWKLLPTGQKFLSGYAVAGTIADAETYAQQKREKGFIDVQVHIREFTKDRGLYWPTWPLANPTMLVKFFSGMNLNRETGKREPKITRGNVDMRNIHRIFTPAGVAKIMNRRTVDISDVKFSALAEASDIGLLSRARLRNQLPAALVGGIGSGIGFAAGAITMGRIMGMEKRKNPHNQLSASARRVLRAWRNNLWAVKPQTTAEVSGIFELIRSGMARPMSKGSSFYIMTAAGKAAWNHLKKKENPGTALPVGAAREAYPKYYGRFLGRELGLYGNPGRGKNPSLDPGFYARQQATETGGWHVPTNPRGNPFYEGEGVVIARTGEVGTITDKVQVGGGFLGLGRQTLYEVQLRDGLKTRVRGRSLRPLNPAG